MARGNTNTRQVRKHQPFMAGIGGNVTTVMMEAGETMALHRVLLVHGGTSTTAYAPTAAGLAAAIAAAVSGDVIIIPGVTIAGNYTFPAGTTAAGIDRERTILTGQITLGAGAALDNLSVARTANDSTSLIGVVGPATGTAYIYSCDISVVQSGAGTGYAVSTTGGTVEVYGGRLRGSTGPIDTDAATSEAWVSAVGAETGLYCATSGAFPANWYTAAFDDGAWTASIARSYIDPYPPFTDSAWVAVDNTGRPGNSYQLFRRAFTPSAAPSSGVLQVAGDNYIDYVYLNGVLVFTGSDTISASIDIASADFASGENVLAIAVRNREVTGSTNNLIALDYRMTAYFGSGAVVTSGVRMDPTEGDPAQGDRGAWDTINYPNRHAKDIEDGIFTYHKNPDLPDDFAIEYASTNVSNPPTQEQINAAFGAPYTAGAGFLGLLDDNGLSLRQYLCASDGANWYTVPFLRAASSLGYASLTRYGAVLESTAAENYYTIEPTVIIDGGLWKMWYTYGGWGDPTHIGYATSPDGLNWTRHPESPVLADYARSVVFKVGTDYHLYATVYPAQNSIDHYTSTDGINWTLAHAAVITTGASGTWEDAAIGNINVWIEGGTWYMFYDGSDGSVWSAGLATSSDGATWAKYESNPILEIPGASPGLGSSSIHKYGSTYYAWTHESTSGTLPSDIVRYHSTDLVHWTSDGIKLTRSGADEGEGESVGQIADPWIVVHNHVMYMFYEGSPDGATGAGQTNIKLITGAEGLIYGD